MAKRKTARPRSTKATSEKSGTFEFAAPAAAARAAQPKVHLIMEGVVCDTDTRGYANPKDRSPAEIVVDASEGFIPLWDCNVTLRWRFQEQSMTVFKDPAAAKVGLQKLFGEGLLLWGDAAPVKFVERDDVWDFEIVMRSLDDCDANGCVLASAFFPDGGRHELVIYPKMLTFPAKEQIETMAHEIGHIFGLRHFFAQIDEQRWRSEIFGTHQPFSIMNYGERSVMTDTDRSDLKQLYEMAWAGELTDINGTPIRLVQPYSAARGNPFERAVASVAGATAGTGGICCGSCGSRLL